MRNAIVKELKDRFFDNYILNSVIEPIQVMNLKLVPLSAVKWTPAGLFAEGFEFKEQAVRPVEPLGVTFEDKERGLWMKVWTEDECVHMVIEETIGDDLNWMKVIFVLC